MERRARCVAAPPASAHRVKAAYQFLVGSSLVTPIGLAITVFVALALTRAAPAYAGLGLIVILLATLTFSVFEKPN